MRIATFNLESLDLPPKARVPLEVRAQILRPVLQRLEADILCLQEVNAPAHSGANRTRPRGARPIARGNNLFELRAGDDHRSA